MSKSRYDFIRNGSAGAIGGQSSQAEGYDAARSARAWQLALTTYVYATIAPPGGNSSVAESVNDSGQIGGLFTRQ